MYSRLYCCITVLLSTVRLFYCLLVQETFQIFCRNRFLHSAFIDFQTPLAHKNSSRDNVLIKNLFRRTKIYDYLKDNVSILDKFTIGIGDRPEMIAEELYGDSTLDYVVILVSGITNITHEWPMQDYQVYDFALSKYGSEVEMNANHHFEKFEIRDNNNRLILPAV